MRLNKEAYEELRKIIENELEKVHGNKKIKLDEDLLDKLLFETIKYDDGKQVKLPIWSGPFLRKLDLSEVNFEDVSWSLLSKYDWKYGNKEEYLLDYNAYNMFDSIKEKYNGIINYSNTNAIIDFTKSWEYKETGNFDIAYCDFSNVDLSNNDISKLRYAFNSNLSNTKIILTKDMFKKEKDVRFNSTNLENVDLSNVSVDGSDFLIDTCIFSTNCNIQNTGLNIIIDKDNTFWYDKSNTTFREVFKEMINDGSLNGTYINGKKLLSKEEKEVLAQKQLRKYENMKKEIFNTIITSIEKQKIYGKYK